MLEVLARRAPAGIEVAHQRPEAPRVVELDEVRDLVRDDVVGERGRDMHQAPGKADAAALGAHAPLGAGVGESYRRGGEAELRGEMRRARLERFESAELQPAHQSFQRAPARRADNQPSRLALHLARTFPDLEHVQLAEKRQRFAAHAEQQRRLGHPRPFVELGEDPAPLLAQEAFDLAPGRAQRRRDLQALRVDRQAERAPAAAGEAVLDATAAELDQPNAFCCSSIHSLAMALMVSGSRCVESMLGPMRMVTVPERLRNALRGQNRPALCATGTTGAPLAAASQAPPGW